MVRLDAIEHSKPNGFPAVYQSLSHKLNSVSDLKLALRSELTAIAAIEVLDAFRSESHNMESHSLELYERILDLLSFRLRTLAKFPKQTNTNFFNFF